MNLFEILIVLLFIVLPLLQQVLGRKKDPELPPAEGEEDAEPETARRGGTARSPASAAPPGERSTGEEGWSVDWGAWPAEPDEEELVEVEAEEPPVEATQPRRPRQARDEPTVVSLEPLHVDRKAEHARFHARTVHVLPPIRPRQPRVAALLRGRGGLRNAVLLSEVLGLPTAFRELPGPPDRE